MRTSLKISPTPSLYLYLHLDTLHVSRVYDILDMSDLYDMVLQMPTKQEQIKASMTIIRRKLTHIIVRAASDCGFPEECQKTNQSRFELEDFIESTLKEMAGEP